MKDSTLNNDVNSHINKIQCSIVRV